MSEIEYSNLLFEISENLDEQNQHDRLLFLCRSKLASGRKERQHPFGKELEQRNHLGLNHLGVMTYLRV